MRDMANNAGSVSIEDDIPVKTSYPIRLVLTENEWRLWLFAIAS